MTKLILLFAVFSIVHFNSIAQNIVEATTFDWAGGQCCVRGKDCNMKFEMEGEHSSVIANRCYVKGTGYLEGLVYDVIINEGKTHWTILIQNSSDMNGLFHHNLDENSPKFNGEAFIDLNISTENYQVEIPLFTNLGSIAYP